MSGNYRVTVGEGVRTLPQVPRAVEWMPLGIGDA
jgi:hypothetical protein